MGGAAATADVRLLTREVRTIAMPFTCAGCSMPTLISKLKIVPSADALVITQAGRGAPAATELAVVGMMPSRVSAGR